MNSKKKLIIPTAIVTLSIALTVSCTNNSPSEDSKEHAVEMNEENLPQEKEKDADKMVEIAGANAYEIQASQDAASRASTSEVKKIANMMVKAHTKMGSEMEMLAGKKGVTLPADMPNEKMNDLENLRNKSGIDYDKDYLDKMKDAHDQVLRKLENMAENTEDAEVRDFANKSIPEIRSHRDMIESARETIKDMKTDARQANNNSK